MSTPTPPPSDPGRPPGQDPSPYGPQYPQQPSYGPQQYGGYDSYAGGLPQASYQIPRDPDARPVTVTLAAWITIALSTLTAVGWLLIALTLGFVLDEMRKNPSDFDLTASDVQAVQDNRPVVYAMVALFIAAAVLAVVVSIFVLRRQAWARIVLVVMASITLVVGLVLILSFVSLLWVAAGIAVIVLLFTGGANEWFSHSRSQWDAPSYGQPGGSYGQQGPPTGW